MPHGAEIAPATIFVRLKCGLNEDGDFSCRNVKKHKHHDDDVEQDAPKQKKKKHHHDDDDDDDHDKHGEEHDKKSEKDNICEGPNNCPPGYRDLETKSKYGACCELIKHEKDEPQKDGPAQKPDQVGACRQVDNMQKMSCPGAISCGPLENGHMTCCCAK